MPARLESWATSLGTMCCRAQLTAQPTAQLPAYVGSAPDCVRWLPSWLLDWPLNFAVQLAAEPPLGAPLAAQSFEEVSELEWCLRFAVPRECGQQSGLFENSF